MNRFRFSIKILLILALAVAAAQPAHPPFVSVSDPADCVVYADAEPASADAYSIDVYSIVETISQQTMRMKRPLSDCVIGIDPGHQRYPNNDPEPVMPGSDMMKKKVSSGTQGRFTGVPEYEINLQVGLKLKERLELLGATVIMTRETHDVDISNAERALMMNEAGADCWLRIHANGNDNPEIFGMFMLVAHIGHMDTDDEAVYYESERLAHVLLERASAATGAQTLGVKMREDQTGFGWSTIPVCTIEMGYMTNEDEDWLLTSDAYQNKIADGLALGFMAYFCLPHNGIDAYER